MTAYEMRISDWSSDVCSSDLDPAVRGRLGSVGRPVPSIELEIRGDDGHVVGPDEIGEVYVRGDQVSGEYTSHSILDADGWYATRAQGRLDSAGFLSLRGRDRKGVVSGKSVSVRVDFGGRRII